LVLPSLSALLLTALLSAASGILLLLAGALTAAALLPATLTALTGLLVLAALARIVRIVCHCYFTPVGRAPCRSNSVPL
jgi:hypothetical protein